LILKDFLWVTIAISLLYKLLLIIPNINKYSMIIKFS